MTLGNQASEKRVDYFIMHYISHYPEKDEVNCSGHCNLCVVLGKTLACAKYKHAENLEIYMLYFLQQFSTKLYSFTNFIHYLLVRTSNR